MSKEKRVGGLGDLNHGILNDLFRVELKTVLENIADDSTDWKAVREINMKVRLRVVSNHRTKVASFFSVSSKLAPKASVAEEMGITTDGEDINLLILAEGTQMELSDIMEIDKKLREEGENDG